MSRLPHQISTDDLLSALDEAEDIETTEWTNDVPHFLSHFKIEQGTYRVRADLLYKLYLLYSKNPIKQAAFTYTISQFLVRNGTRYEYYLINIKPVRIAKVVNTKIKSREVHTTANLALKKHYEKFLLDCGVHKSTTWIEGIILYEIYRHYCINKRIKIRFAPDKFIKISKLYFKTRRIGESRAAWFGIDTNIINRFLTEDMIKRVHERKRTVTPKTKEKLRKAQTGRKREKDSKETKNAKE